MPTMLLILKKIGIVPIRAHHIAHHIKHGQHSASTTECLSATNHSKPPPLSISVCFPVLGLHFIGLLLSAPVKVTDVGCACWHGLAWRPGSCSTLRHTLAACKLASRYRRWLVGHHTRWIARTSRHSRRPTSEALHSQQTHRSLRRPTVAPLSHRTTRVAVARSRSVQHRSRAIHHSAK